MSLDSHRGLQEGPSLGAETLLSPTTQQETPMQRLPAPRVGVLLSSGGNLGKLARDGH